jgi:hypothetical protein
MSILEAVLQGAHIAAQRESLRQVRENQRMQQEKIAYEMAQNNIKLNPNTISTLLNPGSTEAARNLAWADVTAHPDATHLLPALAQASERSLNDWKDHKDANQLIFPDDQADWAVKDESGKPMQPVRDYAVPKWMYVDEGNSASQLKRDMFLESQRQDRPTVLKPGEIGQEEMARSAPPGMQIPAGEKMGRSTWGAMTSQYLKEQERQAPEKQTARLKGELDTSKGADEFVVKKVLGLPDTEVLARAAKSKEFKSYNPALRDMDPAKLREMAAEMSADFLELTTTGGKSPAAAAAMLRARLKKDGDKIVGLNPAPAPPKSPPAGAGTKAAASDSTTTTYQDVFDLLQKAYDKGGLQGARAKVDELGIPITDVRIGDWFHAHAKKKAP